MSEHSFRQRKKAHYSSGPLRNYADLLAEEKKGGGGEGK